MSEEIQLDEVFDENTSTYPVINLKPQLKVPQIWKFDVPGNDSLMARMVSFQSNGDAVKNVKMGDKFVQLFIMSLSDKGNTGELRGGLGSDPIGAVTTIFDTIVDSAKRYRFDAVLFRLPIKKMKGQGPAVQRLIARLAMSRAGGKYVVLKELWDYSSKYAYVLIRRKNVKLEDIPGIPAVSTELFTAVETKVGTTYVEKKSGRPVTKDEAYAASIAEVEDNRTTDRAIAAKTKISRRMAIAAQYGNIQYTGKGWNSDIKAERDKLNANPPVNLTSKEEVKSPEISSISDSGKRQVENFMENDTFRNMDVDAFIAMTPEQRIDNTSYYTRNMIDRVKHRIETINKGINIATPLQKDQIDRTAIEAVQQAHKVMAEFNGKNHVEIYTKLANIHINNYTREELGSLERDSFIAAMIEDFTEQSTHGVREAYRALGLNLADKIPKGSAEAKAITRYCGSGFGDINDFLNGQDPADARTREVIIPALDKAFEHGIKLPAGTPLFRGMLLGSDILGKVLEEKVFYFTNFISTSLAPAFAGMYGNSTRAFNDVGSDIVDIDADEAIPEFSAGKAARIGMQIKGADKIKVIAPGELSPHVIECEVILPRGTAVRINKAYLSLNTPIKKTAFLDTTIINPQSLDESTEIYDGDALINEGVVKKLSFTDFLKENEVVVDEDIMPEPEPESVIRPSIVESSPELDAWLKLIDTDNLPERFVK